MNLMVKNSLNAIAFAKVYEDHSESVSMTIPDQTMTVREILVRYARGLSISDGRVPIYEGEDDVMPDLAHMDLADRQEIMEAVASDIEATRLKHEKYLASKKAKESEDHWRKKFAKERQNTPEAAILTERSETLNKP